MQSKYLEVPKSRTDCQGLPKAIGVAVFELPTIERGPTWTAMLPKGHHLEYTSYGQSGFKTHLDTPLRQLTSVDFSVNGKRSVPKCRGFLRYPWARTP